MTRNRELGEEAMATYELAMSESARLCTKIENIFIQIRYYLTQRKFESRHLALVSVIDLMQVLDRPDVRARLIQLLQLIQDYLGSLIGKNPHEDHRIVKLMALFDEDFRRIYASSNRLGGELFDDALLMLLRSHLNIHGQAAYQLAPICQLWKEQDDGLLFSCFQRWIEPLLPLECMVLRIMRFMRENYQTSVCEVSNGFSKWDIPSDAPIFMVGVAVPNTILPAVSCGQKLVSVTFYTALWGQDQVLQRYEGPVRFEWMICSLPTTRRKLR